MFEIDGMRVEIGKPISTEGGVIFGARRIRRSAWFKVLVAELRKVVTAVNGQRYGFAAEPKLSRTLVALIAGMAMGYRSGKEIADVIGADRLWREVLGARVTQIDLSRLVGILADRGLNPLRRSVLGSASEGGRTLHLDGDSSLLELHGKQEGGAWNGHYQDFGYHAGWLFDRSGRLAAFWLMEGNAHTAQGLTDQLTWMLKEGRQVASYRGDAGMPSAKLLKLLNKEHVDFVLRLRANTRLDEVTQGLSPYIPPGRRHRLLRVRLPGQDLGPGAPGGGQVPGSRGRGWRSSPVHRELLLRHLPRRGPRCRGEALTEA
jgi:hypothetical protein